MTMHTVALLVLLAAIGQPDSRSRPFVPAIGASPVDNRQERRHSSCRMSTRPLDLLQGTLDLLILRTLALQPMHGWGISQRIQQMSDDVLRVNQGSLYPALQRLETAGWIDSEWGASENNRQAKFYRLTRTGQKQLKAESDSWARMTEAVGKVLKGSEGF